MKKYLIALLAFVTVMLSFVMTRQESVINAVNPITSDLPIVPIIILGCVAVAAAVVFVVMGAIGKKRR
ncbi:MAG: hypothetical protein IKV54_04680 [Clostridia bacterium]|nr:hypothetical protein [Clostridia bacterium]